MTKCPECGLEVDGAHSSEADCSKAWGDIVYSAAVGLMNQLIELGDCTRNEKGWPVYASFEDWYYEACISLALKKAASSSERGRLLQAAEAVGRLDPKDLKWRLRSE